MMKESIGTLALRAFGGFTAAVVLVSAAFYLDLLPVDARGERGDPASGELTLLFFGWVVFSPVVETLLLAALFRIFSVY
ncbi:MAG TPA: hypothetical protein VK325_11260 [Pseudoxanthomonas sp.]|nr:hypothetical protein [Pseudoxanthomonas sp.]